MRIQKEGKIPILDIGEKSAVEIKRRNIFPNALFVFLAPEDLSYLQKKLDERNKDDYDSKFLRITEAPYEIELAMDSRIYENGQNILRSKTFKGVTNLLIKKVKNHFGLH